MNGRAVGAPIVLKGTHFEQAPALPGLPGSATTRPFGPGGAEWNLVNGCAVGAPIFVDVTKGLSLCHIVVSLLMLGTPSGGGGAGVLLEGLGEGGLLRVA